MLYLAIALCFVALLAWDVLRRRALLDAVDKPLLQKLETRVDELEHALKNLHSAQARSATHLHALTGSRKRRSP